VISVSPLAELFRVLRDPGVHGIMWGSDLVVILVRFFIDFRAAFVRLGRLGRGSDLCVICSEMLCDSGAAFVRLGHLVKVVICRFHMGGIDLVVIPSCFFVSLGAAFVNYGRAAVFVKM